MLFKKKKVENVAVPTWEETVALMRDKSLNFYAEILRVIYSPDGERRVILLKSEKGFITYEFERLFPFDEDELKYMTKGDLPAYWQPKGSQFVSVFATEDEALKELYADPEYKTYFIK